MTALGVLCCFALFVCLTLLASFFLPSHLSFKNMYTCTFDIASGSNNRLNRITSAGDVRYAGYSSGEKGRGSSSGEKDRPRRSHDDRGRGRSSAEGSRASSRSSQRGSGGGSSSGGGGGGRMKLSASGSSGGADGPRKVSCTCRQRK